MYHPLEFTKPLSQLISIVQGRRADASVMPILQIRNMVQAGGEPKSCGAIACVQISKISCPRVFQFSENLSRGNQAQAWGPKGVEGKGTMVHCVPARPRCQSQRFFTLGLIRSPLQTCKADSIVLRLGEEL